MWNYLTTNTRLLNYFGLLTWCSVSSEDCDVTSEKLQFIWFFACNANKSLPPSLHFTLSLCTVHVMHLMLRRCYRSYFSQVLHPSVHYIDCNIGSTRSMRGSQATKKCPRTTSVVKGNENFNPKIHCMLYQVKANMIIKRSPKNVDSCSRKEAETSHLQHRTSSKGSPTWTTIITKS